MADTGVDVGVNVTPEVYRERALQLANLYEQISQASGSGKSAGERAIANRLVEKYNREVEDLFNQLSRAFNSVDTELMVALYTGLKRRIEKNFSDKVDEFLTAEAEKNKSDLPTEDVDINKLTEEYKEGVKQLGLLKSVLEMFGHKDSIADVEPPKKMTGARGPRGPRALSLVQFSIDGTDLSAADNSVTEVARKLGFDDKTETNDKGEEVKTTAGKQFREFLAANGVDVKNVPDTFGPFTGPNGSTVQGRKFAAKADDDDDENEEADDSAVV